MEPNNFKHLKRKYSLLSLPKMKVSLGLYFLNYEFLNSSEVLFLFFNKFLVSRK